MKREDYFNLMDCVSEEDITEMMQYCRSGQFSDREEEIVMTKQNHAESESKRGKGIAAAVAAVLVCANVAGGAYLLNSGRQPEHSAGTSVQSAPIEEVTAAVTTEALSTESVTTEADKPAELPQYVKLMQEYFTKTTGQKCDYDFTGLGQDYNYEYEYPDYTMTLKSVVGCDWVVYYFYDIKPKDTSEPDYFEFQSKIGDNNIIGNVRAIKDTTVNFAFCEERMGFLSEPERILENGVWHCYSMVVNRSDKPFFHGENEGTKLLILDYQNSLEAAKEPPAPVMFDFTTKEFPLHKTDAPELSAYVTDETDEFWQQHAEEQLAAMCRQTDAHPLTNCAETPFGTFYISDTYYDGIEHAVSEGFSADCFAVNGKPVTRYGCVAWDQRSKLLDGSDHGNVYLFIPEVPAANP